jgi:hypothetical protein
MERYELEGKKTYKNPQNIDNRGNFRRSNDHALRLCKESLRTETGMIRKSKPLFRTTLS